MEWEHECTEAGCRCPKCGKDVYYYPPSGEHACVDPQCAWRDDDKYMLHTFINAYYSGRQNGKTSRIEAMKEKHRNGPPVKG